MIATSLYTGRRATQISGRQHYMLTRTQIEVDKEIAADNAADADFDAAQRDAGDPNKMSVTTPLFVLGFADATGPFILVGGLLLLVAKVWSLRRRRSTTPGRPPADELS